MGKWRYGVILDAGSSGTRIYIYRWLNSARARLEATPELLHSLPKLHSKKKWTKKIHPGVSTFGTNPTAVGDDHLKELLDHALDIIPESQINDTPLFLMATAGMRLLPASQRTSLLNEICAYVKSETDFFLPDCGLHIQTISGETEGLYGWVAANYLLGGFDHPKSHDHGKNHHTYGFLDMGGASAQIAFAPNATEAARHADDLKLLRMRTLDGESEEYKVFVATWLGFGVNQARQRYVDALMEASLTPNVKELPDPCLPVGLTVSLDGEVLDAKQAKASRAPRLIGTGRFDECLRQTYPLLDKDAPCLDKPCLLHGQHTPAIDFDVNHFVGVSEFWHTTHGIFEVSEEDKGYDFNAYQSLVRDFCSQDWEEIEAGVASKKWGKKTDEKIAQEVCFKASWLINVLHDGIGIPRVGLEKTPLSHNTTKDVLDAAKEKGLLVPFKPIDKVDGTEVSWTLGKMVLYAAGQVEPRDSALPVGFGSNVAGIPADFQYAGSNATAWIGGSDDDDDDDDDWSDAADEFLEHNGPGSKRGGMFLILLLVFFCYFFRKRERRLRYFNKLQNTFRRTTRRPGSPKKPSRGFFGASKFFGRSSGSYERVLEEGDADEFELQGTESENENSDSTEGSRVGRSSGLATPKLSVVSFDSSSFFDHAPVHGASSSGAPPTAPSAMDRSGLVVRTESRDRLAVGSTLLGAGRRSRAGSPTRSKSPLMVSLDED